MSDDGDRGALESLYLLTFVLPGAALAAAVGVPCVVGKSMALLRPGRAPRSRSFR